ncbi:phenylalanine--tRNA ligase subunit beta [Mycoplasma iguanae]|uniref:Phenylalanine--tRNA ligase beta subunit n=1 Tax=Mycoplasma iguanae TaxID=292461 RepID=A0ABY5R7N7_9MOLU|nr:phenylalanine--tRNA ligase subunit beta [Mycoplasma iguanae]UVD81498.1 phenylalanine--tRNA ligase subunit beta [Mycoplasma iguanae]
MIFSYKKLLQLANINVSIDQLAKVITNLGFEVESYELFSKVKGIKFGHVQKVYKNPNADKLNVCEIEFADKKRVIQTNANNVKVGDYLMAFVEGASSGDIVFGPKEMQGVISEGMLCSLNEIGFDISYAPSEMAEGIFTFKEQIDLSIDPVEFFDLNDYLIDVKILSNRSDANSYLIMAREIAAYYLKEMQQLQTVKPNMESTTKVQAGIQSSLVLIETKNSNISISLQEKLFLVKSQVKLISSVVDLTNLNLLMTGMPTHAYDKAKINTTFLTAKLFTGQFQSLGGKITEFKDGLGILNDKNVVVSLAGIMGGEKTAVSDNTENIIFEMGIFPIKEVRSTVKQLKIESNASKQSSKKISLGTLELGTKFLSQRLEKFSVPINFPTIEQKILEFDWNYLNFIAGENIYGNQDFLRTKKSLEILGFKFDKNKITIPTYRHDITHWQDIVEEFFRFYGYEKFKPQQPQQQVLDEIYTYKDYPTLVANLGYQQVWTYSLISKEKNIFNPFSFDKTIELETFVSKEREQIRNSLAVSLAEVIDYNQKRKIQNISIFDIGMVNKLDRVLSLASTVKSFREIQNDLQTIYQKELIFKKTTAEIFHTGVSAKIYNDNNLVGWIGKIHPKLKISDAFFAEIILPENVQKKVIFQNYDSAPLKIRDVTIEIALDQSPMQWINKFKNIVGVYKVELVDEFMKNDKNNITIRITLAEKAISEIETLIN